jgi:hypothetical protein
MTAFFLDLRALLENSHYFTILYPLFLGKSWEHQGVPRKRGGEKPAGLE